MNAHPKCPECREYMLRTERHHNITRWVVFKWDGEQYRLLEKDDETFETTEIGYICYNENHTKKDVYFADERGQIEHV